MTLMYQLSAQEPLKCNGFSELCSRRFNEVAWITSHDASSNVFSLVNDQERSIEQQLNDGVRGFKLPLHYDYKIFLGYYIDLLDWFKNKYIPLAIKKRKDDLNKQHAGVVQKLQDAKREVDTLNDDIKSLQAEIKQLDDDFDRLPAFSFTEKSKFSDLLPYQNRKKLFDNMLKAKLLAHTVADGVLSAAQSAVDLAINVELGAYIAKLEGEETLAETALAGLKSLKKIDKEAFERQIYACHGLAKWELYGNFVQDLFAKMPAEIRPFFSGLESALTKALNGLREGLFGKEDDTGGALPYTPCALDYGRMTLKNFLLILKNWMAKNPHDILVLELEDRTKDYAKITAIFKETGMFDMLLAQPKDKPWPTLEQMIKTNKKLVVFISSYNPGPEYPWLLNIDDFKPWLMQWDFSGSDYFVSGKYDPAKEFRKGTESTKASQDTVGNWIFTAPHAITVGLSGTKEMARVINKQSVVEKRLVNLMNTTGHIINSISVDFYHLPCAGNEQSCTRDQMDIFKVLDHINGVGAYKGSPLWTKK